MENNISIKLDLLKIPGAKKHENNGVQWLSIPIDYANLYNGEKGVYLDMSAIPLKNPPADRKDTHMVKQNLGKNKFNAMSEDEKKAIPILGNAIVWGDKPSSNQSQKSVKPNNQPPAFL